MICFIRHLSQTFHIVQPVSSFLWTLVVIWISLILSSAEKCKQAFPKYICECCIKDKLKKKEMSSFSHPHVVPNLCDFVWNTKKTFRRMCLLFVNTMKFTQVQSILFCKNYSISLADTQNKVRFFYFWGELSLY